MNSRTAKRRLIHLLLTPAGTLVLAGIFAAALLAWGVEPDSPSFWLILAALTVPFLALDVYILVALRGRGVDLHEVSEAISHPRDGEEA